MGTALDYTLMSCDGVIGLICGMILTFSPDPSQYRCVRAASIIRAWEDDTAGYKGIHEDTHESPLPNLRQCAQGTRDLAARLTGAHLAAQKPTSAASRSPRSAWSDYIYANGQIGSVRLLTASNGAFAASESSRPLDSRAGTETDALGVGPG